MKFNSKLLLEELIRTHILEAVGDVISDTNVARGKLSGTKFINGNSLKKGFGWFVMLMAFIILFKEII